MPAATYASQRTWLSIAFAIAFATGCSGKPAQPPRVTMHDAASADGAASSAGDAVTADGSIADAAADTVADAGMRDAGTTTSHTTTTHATATQTTRPVKLDIADYAKPGEAPDLVPVRGKITIFDFGAAWCAPCKTLEPALAELARRHPASVAIRRIDVVDSDSAAWQRYLAPGGFDLPHLVIFDASGKRVLQASSAPGKLDALIAAARAIVERKP